jgi:DNA-binding NarL/FixJ family response regulator
MSANQLSKLALIPVSQSTDLGSEAVDAPGSQTRLSPRALAERAPHSPIPAAGRGRLNRESLLRGDWTILDVARVDSQLRILLRSGGRQVSGREHEILQAVMSGEADRDISRRMEISRQCVCGHLGNGLSKLGTDSRFACLQVWRALTEIERGRGSRAMIGEVDYGGEKLLSIRCDIPPRPEIEVRLSSAEHHVAWLVCDGLSNRDIALERGTAERTVANQIASIFHKLSVCRRFDVAQFLLGLA